ncbi:von Willebrand factor C and EGF domain-containing protein [Spea bombifrons]|uniref:von Willebrand factor C and EGF domain-containing protein n=1 Tax=Spea bombifrons TaxID=233779 RepID=UPI00234AF931|nr:von Willebrand factor C and EGF domain-containing protein [Spea bombifrons]
MVPLWMGLSCLLLTVSGREGRVYNGRKKPPTLTAPRIRSGPHVCFSGMGGCCPGWTVSPGTGQCLQPVCSYGCGSGFCIAPNLCSCRDGYQGVTCTDEFAGDYEKDLEDKGLSLSCSSARCDQGCRMVNSLPVCSCFHGFFLGKDGKSCYDIDECSRPQASNPCQQQCKNSIGSYRCLCVYGYQISLNGRSCIPNKHPNTIGTATVPCGEYGCELKCNDGGCEHVSRVCPIGFSMIETAGGVTCTDINECVSSSCEGTCINTEGGFTCDCGPGLKLSADGSSCYDVDECSAHRSPCQQRCKNLYGSYRCLCRAGFALHSNGHTCADINECRRPATSHLCQHSCHNTHGSFFCSCREGFRIGSDKFSCIDIDECLENTTLCSLGLCMNTLGSYLCSCPPGFQPIDGVCKEARSTSLPQDTETMHGGRMPPKPTLLGSQRPATTTITPPTVLIHSFISHELLKPTATSVSHRTMTDENPLPPPQHLRTGHSPLAQKASGISHMMMKEDMIMKPGTTPPQHTDIPCWYNKELKLNGSSWAEPECLDCTCLEGTISCQKRICSPNCSHPVLHPDSCCLSCDGCLFEGKLRADGELFPKPPDNCTICICLSGNVTCIPPVCPPVTCTDPYMSDCCLQCPDGCESQGRIYPHGAKFSRDDSGCTSCLCQNGSVECSFVPCPSLDCPREDWVLEAGECCFKCQEPRQHTGCPFDDNGLEIPIGQIWSPGDPCAICICQADSSIVCRKTDCVDTCPHPITVPGQCCPDCSAGCSYGRRTFRNNDSFPSATDPCLTCICLMGTVACSPIECVFSCSYPFHDEGECCPVCRDCTYDGRKVLNGQTFPLESEPCTQCTCQNGEVQCEAIICPASCSHPYVFPGECCSTCEECVFEGHMVENGASFIQKIDPCVVCHCSGGNVRCEERDGPCTLCEQNTQDCTHEVQDALQNNHLQYPGPLTLGSGVTPSQPSRLAMFQKLLSRRNTNNASTAPTGTKAPGGTVPRSTGYRAQSSSHATKHITPTAGSLSFSSSKTNAQYTQALEPDFNRKTRHSVLPGSSLHTSSMSLKLQYVPTSPSVPSDVASRPLPPIATTGQPLPLTSQSTPYLRPYIVSHSNVAVKELVHPYSNTVGPTSTTASPAHSTPSSAHVSKASLNPLHVMGSTPTQASLHVSSPSPKLHSPRNSAPTHGLEGTTGSMIAQTKDKEITRPDVESGDITGCFLYSHAFLNGSVFIADVDHCLQCECLKGELYCKTEGRFPTGLCCRHCFNPAKYLCNKETNQIHSQWDEGQKLCKCKEVILHCQTCATTQGCNSERTSQSSEAEQADKNYVHWVPLIFGEGSDVKGVNNSP